MDNKRSPEEFHFTGDSAHGAGSDVPQSELEMLLTEAKADGVQKLVIGAIISSEAGILLLRRASAENFLPGIHELPSGGVDSGETLLTALIRETYEETALSISRVLKFCGSFDYRSSSGKLARQFNFHVAVAPSEIQLNPAEHDRYLWIRPESPEFETLNLSDETRGIIVGSWE